MRVRDSSEMSDSKGRVSRRPRKGGFRRAGTTYRSALSSVAAKKGFAETDVLLRWPEIVGGLNLGACQPISVKFSGDRAAGATLVVETTSARAPELDMMKPMLLERINQFYGYRAIGRIRIQQTAGTSGFAEDQAGFEGPTTGAPTDQHRSKAASLTEGIASSGLRDALTRMGSHVLAAAPPNPKSHNN